MKKFISTIFLIFILAISSQAANYEFYVSGNLGLSNITGGDSDSAKFGFSTMYGGAVGYRLSDNWSLGFNLSFHQNYNDTTSTSTFKTANSDNATLKWKATKIGLNINRYLTNRDSKLSFYIGTGLGLISWKYMDPVGDTIINVVGVHNETVDYKTSELYFSFLTGTDLTLTPKWAIGIDLSADYLTDAGAEFAPEYKEGRERWQYSLSFSLKFLIGNLINRAEWRSEKSWNQAVATPSNYEVKAKDIDADKDGVLDKDDKCPDTPAGAVVDKNGCAVDTDGDGVSNGLDHCPNTDPQARGMVDIYGCPIDSDFDGFADYLDRCPNNQAGALVDAYGCPVDSDGDDVPDGLDYCPHTLVGIDVDKFGCIDLSFLSRPLVLNIDYISGSFEIDPHTRERLKNLARVLAFVPEIKMDISGYTDNIGTTAANQKLSEKRANRVRDYLVSQGVDTSRMKVYGRGETNFVASNDTAEGRAKNRRIEIIFYK